MGGERETFLETPAPASSPEDPVPASSPPTAAWSGSSQTLRTHESGGEVHFHDDVNKLKAATPSAQWYTVWKDLRNLSLDHPTKAWTYFDGRHGTALFVETNLIRNDNGSYAVDVKQWLVPCAVSENFKKLDAFTFKR